MSCGQITCDSGTVGTNQTLHTCSWGPRPSPAHGRGVSSRVLSWDPCWSPWPFTMRSALRATESAHPSGLHTLSFNLDDWFIVGHAAVGLSVSVEKSLVIPVLCHLPSIPTLADFVGCWWITSGNLKLQRGCGRLLGLAHRTSTPPGRHGTPSAGRSRTIRRVSRGVLSHVIVYWFVRNPLQLSRCASPDLQTLALGEADTDLRLPLGRLLGHALSDDERRRASFGHLRWKPCCPLRLRTWRTWQAQTAAETLCRGACGSDFSGLDQDGGLRRSLIESTLLRRGLGGANLSAESLAPHK